MDGHNSPEAKKLKTNHESDTDSNSGMMNVIDPRVAKSRQELRNAYLTAKPYPHGRIEGLFVDGFLEQVLDEIKNHSKVKFKESDLFRVYQSIDLGNLSNENSQQIMPRLLELKGALYSAEFRALVEQINNLEPNTLTDEVDCAANCHAPGCHLLCHDDVIGTRKVSYIIYLTDPSPEWDVSEGGCLELYDHEHGTPNVFPSKSIPPTFNTMAYFEVKPGVSFHAVQEVLGDRPRLSIQGWYHAKDAPEKIQDATLSRLKSTAKGEDTEGSFTPAEKTSETAADTLSESDRAHLAQFINGTYLTAKSMDEIRQRFEEDSSVQLRDFLKPSTMRKIQNATTKADEACGLDKRGNPPVLDYQTGMDETNWKAVGPAHKQRFLEYVGEQSDEGEESAGALLGSLKASVFESAAFGRYLGLLTSLGTPLGYRGRVRRFRPGMDYTVAHYGILTTKSVLDATLCFAAGNGKQCLRDEETGDLIGNDADAMWELGDYGGFECYIAADDEEDGDGNDSKDNAAAAEYDDEDDTELLSVSASNNTLSLVYRDPGTMRFVKYVGSGAPSSRWDVSMEYEVEDTESDVDSEKPEKVI